MKNDNTQNTSTPVQPTILTSLRPPKTKVTSLTSSDIVAFPESSQAKVQRYYNELHSALVEFGKSGLRIGKVLAEAREYLKPLSLWVAFMDRVPGLSPKTCDRFIKKWEMAQRKLSPALIQLSLMSGIELTGDSPERPFGRFTEAVASVGPPPNDSKSPSRDWQNARTWLADVVKTYNAGLRAKRETTRNIDPVEKASDYLASLARARYATLPEQVKFVKRVCAVALERASVAASKTSVVVSAA